MTVREVIIKDIVDDIDTYKDIFHIYIDLMKEEVDVNYEPSFSFDEFCVKVMENFEDVDDDVVQSLNGPQNLIKRFMNSIFEVACEELNNDEQSVKKLTKVWTVFKIEKNQYS